MSCDPDPTKATGGQCPVNQTCALDGPNRGKCVPATFAKFVQGPPLSSLPSCMKDAITRSSQGKQTLDDDKVMGKMGQPIRGSCRKESGPFIPYCQREEYAQTTYCACQNTILPFPECMSSDCMSPLAYRTVYQQKVAEDAANKCPKQNICNNINSVNGQNNIVTPSQTINCGGTVQKAITQIKAHPVLCVIIFILVVMLAMAVSGSDGGERQLGSVNFAGPDPALGLPEL